jgi:hypothetical protein
MPEAKYSPAKIRQTFALKLSITGSPLAVCLVHLVSLVCLVYLVHLVSLVYSVIVWFNQMHETD